MENQHRKISGYRELSQEEIDLMNEIKAEGLKLGDLLDKVRLHLNAQRKAAQTIENPTEKNTELDRLGSAESYIWMEEARKNYQIATMELVRAVAQPTDGM